MPQRQWASERGILYALDLDGELPPVLARVPAVLSEVRRQDAGLLAEAMGAADERLILDRLASGRRCFGAWLDGQMAAYGWVSRRDECIGEQEREIRLAPREAYIWECATLPQHRGRRLYSALLSYMVGVLRAEGVRRVWIGTSLDNRPSRCGFVNAGFRPVLTLVYARLFSLHVVFEIGHPSALAPLVEAARRAVTASHERAWGPLVLGWTPRAQPPPCADSSAF